MVRIYLSIGLDKCIIERANKPNAETAAAIEEGRKIAYDDNVEGYSNMEDLKKALES